MESMSQNQINQHSTHVLHAGVDQEHSPAIKSQEVVPSPKKASKILRPNSLIVAKFQALVAAGVFGAAAAMTPSTSDAQEVSTQRFEQNVKLGAINGVVGKFGGVIREVGPNKFELQGKTPQERALSLVPRISQETMQYAQAIGVKITDRGGTIFVVNADNSKENLTFTRLHNENHYMTGLSIEKNKKINKEGNEEDDGLLIATSWEEGNYRLKQMIPKTQLVIVRTHTNGHMTADFIGAR